MCGTSIKHVRLEPEVVYLVFIGKDEPTWLRLEELEFEVKITSVV